MTNITSSDCASFNITVGRITSYPLNLDRQVRIDRTTVMGNPFYLPQQGSDADRDFNLKIYRLYLNAVIRNKQDPRIAAETLSQAYGLTIPKTWQRPSRECFMTEFICLVDKAKKQPLELMCFCHPQRCHGDILKSAIAWWIEVNFRGICS